MSYIVRNRLTLPSAGWYNPPPADPRFSPLLYPSHANLPRAFVQGMELDPLRDDAREYARALRAAGVTVRHIECVFILLSFVTSL